MRAVNKQTAIFAVKEYLSICLLEMCRLCRNEFFFEF